jgi:hypothetical protein
MTHTKKNLREVEDSAVNYGLSGCPARDTSSSTPQGDVEPVSDFWTS